MPNNITILIIDDTAAVRDDFCDILSSKWKGIVKTIGFSSRIDAANYIDSRKQFDIVICDVCMNAIEEQVPSLSNSTNLLLKAYSINRNATCILYSGYPQADIDFRDWSIISMEGKSKAFFLEKRNALPMLEKIINRILSNSRAVGTDIKN